MNNLKELFPILNQSFNDLPVVYLDSAATTQKPLSVIEALNKYYKEINANPHRGAYTLSVKATDSFEQGREKVKDFINAKSSKEIIFTKGTTEALNLIAYSYGNLKLNKDDEIVIGITEHHSNLIPWQQIAIAKGCKLNYLYIDSNYEYTMDEIDKKITHKTKLVAIGHASNVLGTLNPVEYVIHKAHEVGAKVVIDAAQSIAHRKVDVQKLDADFLVFSGHKMFAPMGIGVLYGKQELLEEMPPFLYGGDMVEYVYEQETTFAELPHKFEGGTQNVEGVIGLSEAIDFIDSIGIDNIIKHEHEIISYAYDKLSELGFVKIYTTSNKDLLGSVLSFTIDGIHPHDLATILDSKGVCVRAGNHCAQPLMRYLNINSTCRLSVSVYNNKQDIDTLVTALEYARRLFGYGSQ
ncbi:cysteine desulfurase [Clostridium folliculivorans]|uniref:cysteine desulfurase n=1 Tax=Clostridium folliculivorans TaxID=2886038 RepID=A0A9W6D9F0_9CLOT|nr:cysteine desulfurase [Clostridium folliculivorans]GKU23836.1 cysteine desulfurase [Clostridium folliculivorans]GKU29952.1 cysteine desulfurase [Clostridium folliculivorans]